MNVSGTPAVEFREGERLEIALGFGLDAGPHPAAFEVCAAAADEVEGALGALGQEGLGCGQGIVVGDGAVFGLFWGERLRDTEAIKAGINAREMFALRGKIQKIFAGDFL